MEYNLSLTHTTKLFIYGIYYYSITHCSLHSMSLNQMNDIVKHQLNILLLFP